MAFQDLIFNRGEALYPQSCPKPHQITDKYGNPVRDMNGNIVQNVVTEAGKPLEIKGLKDGEYYLREVSAPQGYTVSSQPMTLSIDNNAIAAAAEQNNNTATVLQPVDAPQTIVSAETERARTVKNTANVGATGNAVTLAPSASTTTAAATNPMAPTKKNNEKCQFAAVHILGLATYIAVVIRNGWIAR